MSKSFSRHRRKNVGNQLTSLRSISNVVGAIPEKMNVLAFGCDSYKSSTRLRQLDPVHHFLSKISLIVSVTDLGHLDYVLGPTHFLGRLVIQVRRVHQFKHCLDQLFELGKPEHLGIVFEIFNVILDEQHLLDGGRPLD